MVLATVISAIWICVAALGVTHLNLVVLAITFLLGITLAKNGLDAMRDGLAAIDLVVAGHFNPAIVKVFKKHSPSSLSQPGRKDA
jgi:hypothetical protein